MKLSLSFLLPILVAAAVVADRAVSEEPPGMDPARAKRMEEITSPGKWHKDLAWYEGKWDVEATLAMPDASGKVQAMPPEKGSAVFSWAIPGRFLTESLEVPMMGRTVQGFYVHGYDNHTKNFVTVVMHSMDTSINLFRGVEVDPAGKVFTRYGTINEWMDDTFNKPVKAVTRRLDEDHFETEIWDLQIGEKGFPVLTYRYTRKKS